jgi:hypothetical protein
VTHPIQTVGQNNSTVTPTNAHESEGLARAAREAIELHAHDEPHETA